MYIKNIHVIFLIKNTTMTRIILYKFCPTFILLILYATIQGYKGLDLNLKLMKIP